MSVRRRRGPITDRSFDVVGEWLNEMADAGVKGEDGVMHLPSLDVVREACGLVERAMALIEP